MAVVLVHEASVVSSDPDPQITSRIMNITSVSNQLFTSATSSVQPGSSTPSAADPDGDGDGARVHHGKGGGHMMQAVSQALQSLGMSLPQPSGAASSSSNTSDSSGSSPDDGKVKNDLSQFMHQLFQAVKAEGGSSAGTAGPTSGSGDSQSGFASGLSSLISQVSNGSAPSDLQSAFSQLTSDLSSSASSTSTPAASAGDDQATLQAFLTQLQQTLGYSSSNSALATGTLLTTQV